MDPALERELMTELTRLRDELCGAAKGFCVSLDNRQNLGLFRIFSNISIDKWRAVAKRLDLTGWLTLPIDRDIYPHLTTLQESLERLAYESEHDALTGLANRRAFERTLDLEIERARRAKTVMSLSIIDLDHFKSVNDTYGHPVGDQVLMRLSEIINREKRRYDLAARIGGEEFALIIPGAGQVKTRVMLERMLELISRENFAGENGENFSVTFSAGVTSFRGTSDISVSELVALTDKALYKAKENGRAQVQLAPLPEMETVPRQSLVHANEKKFLFTGKK
ncbi:MAG: GGDEF domain-containing protein [Proteobacteria bacterium]|nr:GGDEF domain-containing protein [Pseudomonadota bacterium]